MSRFHIGLQRSKPGCSPCRGGGRWSARTRCLALARQGSAWGLAGSSEGFPSALLDDPLSEHDDGADGILARDGGQLRNYDVARAEVRTGSLQNPRTPAASS